MTEHHFNGNTSKKSKNYSIEWYTPPEVLEPMVKAFGGRPYLDPASNQLANDLLVKADHFLTKEDDGLKADWHGLADWQDYEFNGGKLPWVWCNPPFGTDIVKKFILKAKTSAMPTVMLLPSVTDRGYYQYALDKCDAFYLMAKRVMFLRPPREDKDPQELWDKPLVCRESNTVGSTLFFFNFSLTSEYGLGCSDALRHAIRSGFDDDSLTDADELLIAGGYRNRPLSRHEGHLFLRYY